MTETHNSQVIKSPEKFIQPTSETEITRMTPKVTYDSALGHMVDSFSEIDMDGLREFYYTLPHKDKPDLEHLRIHFSAGYFKEDYMETGVDVSYGQFYPKGTKALGAKYRDAFPDISDKMPTINIFVGSMLMQKKNRKGLEFVSQTRRVPGNTTEAEGLRLKDKAKAILGSLGAKKQDRLEPHLASINAVLNETLTHELVHFAQMASSEVGVDSDEFEQSLSKKARDLGRVALHYLQEIKGSLAAGGTVTGGLLASGNVLSETFLASAASPGIAVGAGLLAALLYRKTSEPPRPPGKHEEYLMLKIEQDARNHEDQNAGLVGLIAKDTVKLPTGYGPKSFVKDMNPAPLAPLKRRIANGRHKLLAQKSRVKTTRG